MKKGYIGCQIKAISEEEAKNKFFERLKKLTLDDIMAIDIDSFKEDIKNTNIQIADLLKEHRNICKKAGIKSCLNSKLKGEIK
jgi:hypothetical protein